MEENLYIEREILKDKKVKIESELKEKLKYIEQINGKLKALSKESKGSYSEEKENTERIYSLLKKDVENYEGAMKEPYFGRVDFTEKFGTPENLYIGKKSISSSDDGEEIVIDWRAPVADLYYSGTGGEAYYKAPIGVIEGELSLKRKFLFNDEELEKIFDESINELIINGEAGEDLVDEFLKINLEGSRGKKLKEVVATIQKEQNDIIRWPKNLPIIVQGSAGSGKTTIALHRLAYLLYRYRETMEGKDILVIAPNKLFLEYISDILPNLGTSEVSQTTFIEKVTKMLKLKGKIKSKDDKIIEIIESEDDDAKELIIKCANTKGSLAFKNVINRYIALSESTSLDVKDIEIKEYMLFSKKEITRLYLKDLRAYPINKRKDEIKRYLNLKLKERIEILLLQIEREWDFKIKEIKKEDDSLERREKLLKEYNTRDELKSFVKNNAKKAMNEYFKEWRGVTPRTIYLDMFKNEELLKLAINDEISSDVFNYMKKDIISNWENNIIDEDDLAILFYIHIMLEGIDEKDKFKHIVVDEAQDYSPLQIEIIKNLSKGNSITLVGDIAQGIYYYKGIKNWDDVIEKVFDGNSTYISLSQSYRSTVEIIDFASKVLESQNLGLKAAKPVLRHGDVPKINKSSSREESVKIITEIINEIKGNGKTSIAIIARSSKEAIQLSKDIKKYSNDKIQVVKSNEEKSPEDIIIIPSYLTKGLEFDGTIIYNPLECNYKDTILDKRLLYVSLTRALHYEYVVAEGKINKNIKY